MVTKTDPLLQPFHLKGLLLRNRIMSTSHAPGYVVDGNPETRYQLYHAEKAKGGLALTMTVGYGFHKSSTSIDLALMYLDVEKRTTRVNINGYNGTYASEALLFASTVTW